MKLSSTDNECKCEKLSLTYLVHYGLAMLDNAITKYLSPEWYCCRQGRRETTLIGGEEVVFIESPEYAIFIKLPEFYWMR